LVIALGAFMASAFAAPAGEGKPPSRQCNSARKALNTAEGSLAKTDARIAQANKLIGSCGSTPMCDGYGHELRMLE